MSDTTLRDRLTSGAGQPAGTIEVGGQTVHLRRITLRDRLRIVAVNEQKDRPAIERQAEMCRLLLAHPDNTRVFGDDADDVDAALGLVGEDADRVIEAGLEANGLGAGAADAAKKRSRAPTGPTSA